MRRPCAAAVALALCIGSGAMPGARALERPGQARDAISSVSEVLASLPTAPVVPAGYRYATFAVPRVARVDARGCGSRARVLLAAAKVRPVVRRGCRLVGGVWTVNQGRVTVRRAADVDVVPLVSARSVYSHGGFGWTNAQRRAYLQWQQWPPRECAIGSGRGGADCAFVLQAADTGGRGPSVTDVLSQEEWTLTCPEVVAITRTIASWGLAVDPDARVRLESSGCGARPVVVSMRNTVNALPRTEVGNPFLAPGSADRIWPTTDVLNAPAGPVIGPSLFGLHAPELVTSPPVVPFAWLRLWDARTSWAQLEPSRGVFVWQTLDDAVAGAEARGLQVLYVFGDTPGWAGPGGVLPPSRLADYQRFVRAVVARYGDRIAAYEVWNEPNMRIVLASSVADPVRMTQVLADAVDAAGVSALVLTPSTTLRTNAIVESYYASYLVRLASVGWPVDGYTLHSYPLASGGPAARGWQIAQFKQLLRLAGAPSRPIWDTEVNYGLGGRSEPRRQIEGADAQGYLAQTYIDAVRLGIERVDWYLWLSRPFDLLGIQLNPATPDTIRAWQWTHAQLVGASLTACGTSGAAMVCGFERDGQAYALAYSSTGVPAEVAVPSGLTTACDLDGACRGIDGGVVTVGIRPVRLS